MEEKTAPAAKASGCFICEVVRPVLERYWTDATCDHFRNSRIEFLKGMRSLIDQRIDHLSRPAEQKGTSVPVE